MATALDPFGARTTLQTQSGTVQFYRLTSLAERGIADVSRLPYAIKILLENLLRNCDGYLVREEDVVALAQWNAQQPAEREIPFLPARVILQDFTGVPCVADLAAMRGAVVRLGGEPKRINPVVPVDLVIDHSVQVDLFGTAYAFAANVEREYERNRERYAFLRWAQQAFQNFSVVPPGTGIVHQVNLEYLAKVVQTADRPEGRVAYPDTLVGTDSHTTMVNGLGVLGWGVGGIEAEAVMLGQPFYFLTPQVVGFRLTGALREGVTATDLVLTVTQMLRKRGVVNKLVEFYGPGLAQLSLADRATLGNMSPEYGATCGISPIDAETLRYLRMTGRSEEQVDLVERYAKEQGLFRDDAAEPIYSDTLELDMSTVEPSVAGPRRPQDRVAVRDLRRTFGDTLRTFLPAKPGDGGSVQAQAAATAVATAAPAERSAQIVIGNEIVQLTDGAVVLAAITSCTNTSNPSVMIGAGLLARNAVKRGLTTKPWVKTSLAPGSPVVADYLERAGLTPYLLALRFNVDAFGCTTCIGNSGPLPEPVARAVREHDLTVAAVLSGNRNFEGRINPLCRMAYLASPPLVVAFALAGTINIDLTSEPLAYDPNGEPVYLRDIWPSQEEIQQTIAQAVAPELYQRRFARVFEGDERWRALPIPAGDIYAWDPASTYIQEPPFFEGLTMEPAPLCDIRGARVLVMLGDSVTTDHISPAGTIPVDSPAGRFLRERGVEPAEFNTFGARRGNHEVMMRGTFGNIRLRNELVPGREGFWTVHLPSGEVMTIYDAAMRYQAESVPLIVIAGQEYGTGSSRDWAAKGPQLLGVRAVIAESYERIHRSNLVGMGVLPLQFRSGESRKSLGLTGREVFDVEGIAEDLAPHKEVTVRARREDGSTFTFQAIVRIDSPVEIEYYRNGGILQTVLRKMMRAS